MKINKLVLLIKKINMTKIVIAGFLFAALLASCSTVGFMSKPEKLIIYPEPPDTTRIQFLTKISNSAEITGQRSGFSRFIMGQDKVYDIGRPYGIAVNKNKIYICDNLIKALIIMDIAQNKYENFQPEAYGKLQNPINCFVDDKDNLFVADVDRGDIVVFDENLKYKKHFGKGIVTKPTDVFVYGDKIYVADIKTNNVMLFDRNTYEFIKPLVDVDVSDTAFIHQPTNIYIRNDLIYVSDVGEANVKTYDMRGNFLNAVGSPGLRHGNMVRPKGIAVDKDNYLYVADASFENVQIFNNEGKVLMSFGGPYKGPGDMYLPAKITIDYDHNEFFKKFVDEKLDLKYVIFVTNQYGPDKITIYGRVEPK